MNTSAQGRDLFGISQPYFNEMRGEDNGFLVVLALVG
jgi:hypothetical protein